METSITPTPTSVAPSGNGAKIALVLFGLALIGGGLYYYYNVYQPAQLTPEKKFERMISFVKQELNDEQSS